MTMQFQVFNIITGIFVVTVNAQINLAVEGFASQSTTLSLTIGGETVLYDAILAIEGPATTLWADGCASTNTKQMTAWWSLELPIEAFITHIEIYYRSFDAKRMDKFSLILSNGSSIGDSSNVVCYKDTDEGLPEFIQNRTCNMLARSFFFFNENNIQAFVELCYIEINGCWKGTWGKSCSMSCPIKCTHKQCYPGNGLCVWGCDSLYCLNDQCDASTSVCTTGCISGRAGKFCSHYNVAYNGTAKQIPLDVKAHYAIDGKRDTCITFTATEQTSYIQIDVRSISLITAIYITLGDIDLLVGNHIIHCSNTSDSWTNGIELFNGQQLNKDLDVFGFCRYVIYVPPIGTENSKLDLCEMEIGGCSNKTYGLNCQTSCSKNCKGPCHLLTGDCLFGCLDGFRGEKCGEACSHGFFGGHCRRNCSKHCVIPPCDHVTGVCNGGCTKGWEGLNCTKECSNGRFGFNCSESCDGCIDNACSRIDGLCVHANRCKPGYEYGRYCNKTCEDWRFGINCNKRCNCLKSPCDKLTGSCSDGCEIGWKTDSCDEECSTGSYGWGCGTFCDGCLNITCDKVDGNCTLGCADGFGGHKCNSKVYQEPASTNPDPAIGGGISAAIMVIIIAVIAFIIFRRRSHFKHGRYSENSPQSNIYANLEREQHINKGCVSDADGLYVSLKKNRRASISEITTEIYVEKNSDDESNVYNNIASVQSVDNYKILLGDLKKVIDMKKRNEGFKKEYEILPKGPVYPHNEGSKEENKLKNRFLTTWPYDHSRVVLEGDTKHDYINASYIAGYYNEKAYIASQGPKRNSVRDFWHMIWQEQVGKIVMVTQLEENKRKKCEQYWPHAVNKSMVIEKYRLTLKNETHHTVYVYRLIAVYDKTTQRERNIHHFHFIQWPDQGVPDSINLVNFYRKVVREQHDQCGQHDQSGPMVVHCSAGVGRTGTLIAVDALYEHGKKVGSVDVMEYVQMMKKDRMNMIQTHEQYEVVFEALLELFTVQDTSIPRNIFCGYIEKQENKRLPQNQTMYRQEYQKLQSLKPSYKPAEYKSARSRENIQKNSSTNVYPHDNYRPYLMSFGKTRNDYINAVIVPGYSAESKFLVTQCPLVETVVDFWTMVYDHGSKIVVMLDLANKNAALWIDEKENLECEQFSVVKDKSSLQSELKLSLNHKKNKERQSITVFTATKWTANTDVPSSPEYMLELIQRVIGCWEINKGPITVVCSDGCSKSGLFVALRLALEKMQMDDEVDMFQVVRAIQIRRPEFLPEFDQYEYCYKCIKSLLEAESRDSLYANYK